MVVQQDPHSEVLEALVELYFRLNGYFCISNYLQHKVTDCGLATETDLLALRMPHQKELLQNGQEQPNDKVLVLPEDDDLIDCVIAEVKRACVKFNRSISGTEGVDRIAGALRMFGVFPDDSFTSPGAALNLASDLHTQVERAEWNDFPKSGEDIRKGYRTSVRMLVFASERPERAGKRRHIDLNHVLKFVMGRMKPGAVCAKYDRLPWRGWTRLIVETADESQGQDGLAIDEFVDRVLRRR